MVGINDRTAIHLFFVNIPVIRKNSPKMNSPPILAIVNPLHAFILFEIRMSFICDGTVLPNRSLCQSLYLQIRLESIHVSDNNAPNR